MRSVPADSVAGANVGLTVELLKITTPQQGGEEQISRQVEVLRDRLGSAMRIADQLAGPPNVVPASHMSEHYIRTLLKMRRNRSRFFRDGLFADPAWDILLELYGAALGQYRISVSKLCAAAAVPATTALRWVNQLQDEGLIDRRRDPTDGRRQFLALSEKGIDAMNSYFRTVQAGAALI